MSIGAVLSQLGALKPDTTPPADADAGSAPAATSPAGGDKAIMSRPAGFAAFMAADSSAKPAAGAVAGLADRMVQDAQAYNTEGRREAAASSAAAAVGGILAEKRATEDRNRMRMGVNPNSGRFSSAGDDVRGALAAVTASNQARQQVEDISQQRIKEAIGAQGAAADLGLRLDDAAMNKLKLAESINQYDQNYALDMKRLDSQNQYNAADLDLRRYGVDKNISVQSGANSGAAWGSAAAAGISFLKDSGLAAKAGDWISSLF